MTFEEFRSAVEATHSYYPGWRDGQRMFNLLRHVNPACAEQLRGTQADPFYEDSRIPAAWRFVSEHWT